MSYRPDHIEDISATLNNIPDSSDTFKIVIFAEEYADEVYWEDGMPIIDGRPKSFANAARNWVEDNPMIAYQKTTYSPDGTPIGTETAHKPLEAVILVGYGKEEITKAFNDLNGSGFVQGDTKLIVMGHAGSTFGGVDAGGWGSIMKSTGMTNKFTQVAYGACAQGEAAQLCGNLSRSFGPETEVLAQVGQSWGVGSTYNTWTKKDPLTGVPRGPNFETAHQEPRDWQEQVFTVGAGYVKFHADYGETEIINPGWDNYKLEDRAFALEEADAIVGRTKDPQAIRKYEEDYFKWADPSEEWQEEYFERVEQEEPGPFSSNIPIPDEPIRPDTLPMYEDDYQSMRRKVLFELQEEWWGETHDGEALPEELIWDESLGDGWVGATFSRADSDAFDEWFHQKERAMIESGEMTFSIEDIDEGRDAEYHGSSQWVYGEEYQTPSGEIRQREGGFRGATNLLAWEANKRLLAQRAIPMTDEETAAWKQYSQDDAEYLEARRQQQKLMYTAWGKDPSRGDKPVRPPWIGGEHLLDLEDNIPYTFEETLENPDLAYELMEGGNLSSADSQGTKIDFWEARTTMGDLYDSGVPAAVDAYKQAYTKLHDSGFQEFAELGKDPTEYSTWDTSGQNALFQSLLDLEALRLYSLSGSSGYEYQVEQD